LAFFPARLDFSLNFSTSVALEFNLGILLQLLTDDVLVRGDTKLLTTVAIAVKPEASTFGHGEHKCHIQAGMAETSNILYSSETALQFMLRKARLITDL